MGQLSPLLRNIGREGSFYDRSVDIISDYNGSTEHSTTAEIAQWLLDGNTALTIEDYHATNLKDQSGFLKIAENSTNTVNMQVNGTPVLLKKGRRVVFEAKLRFDGSAFGGGSADGDDPEWFVGLAAPDTTVIAGVSDYVGVYSNTSAFTMDYLFAKNASSTFTDSTAASKTVTGETNAKLVDENNTNLTYNSTTFITIHFEIYGLTRIKYWINGIARADVEFLVDGTTQRDAPDDIGLTPTFALTGGTDFVTADYFLCVADDDRNITAT